MFWEKLEVWIIKSYDLKCWQLPSYTCSSQKPWSWLLSWLSLTPLFLSKPTSNLSGNPVGCTLNNIHNLITSYRSLLYYYSPNHHYLFPGLLQYPPSWSPFYAFLPIVGEILLKHKSGLVAFLFTTIQRLPISLSKVESPTNAPWGSLTSPLPQLACLFLR